MMRQPSDRHLLLILAICLALSACAPPSQRSSDDAADRALITPCGPPPASIPAIIIPTNQLLEANYELEMQGEMIQEAMREGPFAEHFGDLYLEWADGMPDQLIVQVTEEREAIRSYLIEQGAAPDAFEVRLVDDTLAELQAAQERLLDGLAQTFGKGVGFGVGIDTARNCVAASVESEPLAAALGFDPGDQPVPYEQWPEPLRRAFAGLPSDVSVELTGGFSEFVLDN